MFRMSRMAVGWADYPFIWTKFIETEMQWTVCIVHHRIDSQPWQVNRIGFRDLFRIIVRCWTSRANRTKWMLDVAAHFEFSICQIGVAKFSRHFPIRSLKLTDRLMKGSLHRVGHIRAMLESLERNSAEESMVTNTHTNTHTCTQMTSTSMACGMRATSKSARSLPNRPSSKRLLPKRVHHKNETSSNLDVPVFSFENLCDCKCDMLILWNISVLAFMH